MGQLLFLVQELYHNQVEKIIKEESCCSYTTHVTQ
jgi:hypothetical protein